MAKVCRSFGDNTVVAGYGQRIGTVLLVTLTMIFYYARGVHLKLNTCPFIPAARNPISVIVLLNLLRKEE
jgi:hypothetical protein